MGLDEPLSEDGAGAGGCLDVRDAEAVARDRDALIEATDAQPTRDRRVGAPALRDRERAHRPGGEAGERAQLRQGGYHNPAIVLQTGVALAAG